MLGITAGWRVFWLQFIRHLSPSIAQQLERVQLGDLLGPVGPRLWAHSFVGPCWAPGPVGPILRDSFVGPCWARALGPFICWAPGLVGALLGPFIRSVKSTFLSKNVVLRMGSIWKMGGHRTVKIQVVAISLLLLVVRENCVAATGRFHSFCCFVSKQCFSPKLRQKCLWVVGEHPDLLGTHFEKKKHA